MTKNIINIGAVMIICGIILATLLAIMSFQVPQAGASAMNGVGARVATTSTSAVGPGQKIMIFGSSTNAMWRTNCAARVITTVASPIMIEFGPQGSTTVSGMIGHLQAASTTIAYDGDIYGCDLVTVYSFSSSTITLTETQ